MVALAFVRVQVTNGDWTAQALDKDTFEHLSHGLAGAELQSLLLEVMGQRAEQRAPKEVLAQYQRDKFCLPAVVDQRVSLEVDRHLFAAAPQFEAIELSPVAQLGTCSTVAYGFRSGLTPRVKRRCRSRTVATSTGSLACVRIVVRCSSPPAPAHN